ncbi:hypothetical protein DESC_260129 [Desulfosarcina cetonica]|nr:hypothetical protein DESC_260129 [Desulfosarcina cetonica]
MPQLEVQFRSDGTGSEQWGTMSLSDDHIARLLGIFKGGVPDALTAKRQFTYYLFIDGPGHPRAFELRRLNRNVNSSR